MMMFDAAQTLAEELTRLRRDIHAHPELGFQEFRTAGLVANTLRELGIDVQEGVGRTGVVGELRGGAGPTIAIRADMDALPIDEQNESEYRSTHNGVMHACGHDAHTAILLGTAHLLKQSLVQESWAGNVRLLFQPSEEQFGTDGIGGAAAMLADGALDGVDAVIALHVFSHVEAGVCLFQDGYALAAADSFDAWIRGTGGHGAYPHDGTDPIYMLAHVLHALYAIPSRRINPLHTSVVSVGQVHAGQASNVIPNELYLNGTLRSYNAEVRQQLRVEVENALRLSEQFGGSYELRISEGCPALFNHGEVNEWLRTAARRFVGQSRTRDHMFGLGYEDFAYMAQTVPGAMFGLGASLNDGRRHAHHTSTFDIDERVLPLGCAILAETARQFVTGTVRASWLKA